MRNIASSGFQRVVWRAGEPLGLWDGVPDFTGSLRHNCSRGDFLNTVWRLLLRHAGMHTIMSNLEDL